MGARSAAHPDLARAVTGQEDAAVTAQAAALGGNVVAVHHPRRKQPLRQRGVEAAGDGVFDDGALVIGEEGAHLAGGRAGTADTRSEEHTSELQSQSNLVCRLLLEKKKYVFDT